MFIKCSLDLIEKEISGGDDTACEDDFFRACCVEHIDAEQAEDIGGTFGDFKGEFIICFCVVVDIFAGEVFYFTV